MTRRTHRLFSPAPPERMDAGARQPEIDALRVGAIAVVFGVHAAQIFSPFEDWHISSPDTSQVLAQFTVFAGTWVMPLFMLLAGAGAWFSRSRRDDWTYLRVRVARLLVPLVAGSLLLVPPQMYYRRVFRGQFEGGFLEFYPRFFDGVFPEGNLSWGHLWFIAYLFTYMLAAIPLFRALDSRGGKALLARAASWVERPGGIFVPFLPLAAGQLVLRVSHPQTTGALVGDWATHAWLFTAFVYGYALLAEPRLLQVVTTRWRSALAPALATSLALAVWAWPGDVYQRIPGGEVSGAFLLFWLGFTLCSWSWLAVLLGAARERIGHETPFLRWAAPLVYPFYVFHQTVIVVVAFYLVALPLGVHARFTLVAAVSLMATLGVMEVTRRVPGVRALVGLTPRNPAPDGGS